MNRELVVLLVFALLLFGAVVGLFVADPHRIFDSAGAGLAGPALGHRERVPLPDTLPPRFARPSPSALTVTFPVGAEGAARGGHLVREGADGTARTWCWIELNPRDDWIVDAGPVDCDRCVRLHTVVTARSRERGAS